MSRQNKSPPATANEQAPTLELRIPISPRPTDMRMVQYFVESLREFGGPIGRQAHCVVSVGADEPPRDLKAEFPWTASHKIDFHWVDRELFRSWEYDATGFDRFEIESDADVVALIDADMLVAGDFDEAVWEAHRGQCCLGTIAHLSPFCFYQTALPSRWSGLRFLARKFSFHLLADQSSQIWWQRIFEAANISLPELDFRHTGWGLNWERICDLKVSQDASHKHCPPYFNYGFVVAPKIVVERMQDHFIADLEAVDRVVTTIFRSQIANTLNLARQQVACRALPINYNFTLNVPRDEFRRLNPDPDGMDSDQDIKVFHYIGGRSHFQSHDAVETLLKRRDLDGAWPEFQKKLQHIHDKIAGKAST